jgi:hypothetical protein
LNRRVVGRIGFEAFPMFGVVGRIGFAAFVALPVKSI